MVVAACAWCIYACAWTARVCIDCACECMWSGQMVSCVPGISEICTTLGAPSLCYA